MAVSKIWRSRIHLPKASEGWLVCVVIVSDLGVGGTGGFPTVGPCRTGEDRLIESADLERNGRGSTVEPCCTGEDQPMDSVYLERNGRGSTVGSCPT